MSTAETPRRVIQGSFRLEAMSKEDIDILAELLRLRILEYEAKDENAGWYGYGVLVKNVRRRPQRHRFQTDTREYQRNYDRG